MRWIALLLLATSSIATAAPVPGVCRIGALANQVYAPLVLTFPIDLSEPIPAAVTVDAETGTFTLDGGSVVVPPYPFGFSEARDVLTLADEVFSGTIDSAGTVTLARVRTTVCTFGTPAGTDCVPGNLCSDDLALPCIPGPGAGTGCAAGVCQGVCRDDRTRTCAVDADCGAGGFCGTGRIVPFTMTLSTGPSRFGDITIQGVPLDFSTGTLTLEYIGATPPESPVIGGTGVSGFTLACTLDPIPAAATLPPPPTWQQARGTVKLGRGGAGAADDQLALRGIFGALGGDGIFDVDPLVFTIGTSDATVVTLEVPAGALTANRKRTRFKLKDTAGTVRVTPTPPGGVVASHTIALKKRKRTGDYAVTLASKGLRLDALAAPQVSTAVTLGLQHAAETGAARVKGRRVTF